MDIEKNCIYCGTIFEAPLWENEVPGMNGEYSGICPKCQKENKVYNIREGMVKKGGINKASITPEPTPPKGQSPFFVFLDAAKIISAFCVQYKWCLKCPLDMSTSTLPGGMASPNRCLLLDRPADWNHELIKERLDKLTKEDTNGK